MKGPDQTVADDAGEQTVVGWATSIAAGPTKESGQALDFIVSNDNPAIFSSAPAVSSAGTLTYAPDPTASGNAAVTVTLHDDGGTANGGADSSPPETFTISVFQAPLAFDAASGGSTVGNQSSVTFSHTCTGSGLILLVKVGYGQATDHTTSVTYAGVPLTKGFRNGASNIEHQLWYLVAPPVGDHPVTITLDTPTVILGNTVSLSGAAQTGQFGATGGTSANGTNSLTTITTATASSWIVDGILTDTNALSAGLGQTIVSEQPAASGTQRGALSLRATLTPGDYSGTWNWATGVATYNAIAVEILP